MKYELIFILGSKDGVPLEDLQLLDSPSSSEVYWLDTEKLLILLGEVEHTALILH